MQYIVHRRFRAKTISGVMNLPYGTKCETQGEFITFRGQAIAAVTSENAHQYFARNDDGQGLIRGELTQEIQRLLSNRNDKVKGRAGTWQEAWGRIWEDLSIRKYKRVEHADHWLFNHAFFNAPIEDLEYILDIVKGVKHEQDNQN